MVSWEKRHLSALDNFTELSLAESSLAVEAAVERLFVEPCHAQGVAAKLVARASLELPDLLTPHLAGLWEIRPNSKAYYSEFPWRAADASEISRLRMMLRLPFKAKKLERIAQALLQTREPAVFHDVFDVLEHLKLPDVITSFWSIGIDAATLSVFRPLCLEAVHHVIFPAEYLARPDYAVRTTWASFDTTVTELMTFGGASDLTCIRCSRQLARLLLIDNRNGSFAGLSMAFIETVTCLACVGWEGGELFFRHDNEGWAHPAYASEADDIASYELIEEWAGPFRPLPETSVLIAPTPLRWRQQDWGLSSGQNLHRIGGEPTFVQSAHYPQCSMCKATMIFLCQIDSELPSSDQEGEWSWGSGGLVYVFWCDGCRVSATFIQST